MPKIRIQHFTKNNSLIGEPVFIESSYIPRVGELLDSSNILDRSTNNIYIVTGLVHRITEEGLLPCITVQNWYRGLRSELLEEFGWLPQTSDTICAYDEDVYFD
jgi:hypothetical protein